MAIRVTRMCCSKRSWLVKAMVVASLLVFKVLWSRRKGEIGQQEGNERRQAAKFFKTQVRPEHRDMFASWEERRCRGEEQRIYLNPGQQVLLQSAGFEGEGMPAKCKERYEVTLEIANQDLSQWRIKVEVEDLEMACSSSNLTVTEEGERVTRMRYCNQMAASKIYTSHEHRLLLMLKNKDGLGAKVGIRLTAEYVCGGKFTEDTGSLLSPFWPKNYFNSESCFYDIMAPDDKRVSLTCHDFNLSTNCQKKDKCRKHGGDRTYLEDVNSDERYEDTELLGKTITSKSNHHTLYFLSNAIDLGKDIGFGFNCSYAFF